MYSVGFAKPMKKGRAQTPLSWNSQFSEENTCQTHSDIKHNMVKTVRTTVKNIKYRGYRCTGSGLLILNSSLGSEKDSGKRCHFS